MSNTNKTAKSIAAIITFIGCIALIPVALQFRIEVLKLKLETFPIILIAVGVILVAAFIVGAMSSLVEMIRNYIRTKHEEKEEEEN